MKSAFNSKNFIKIRSEISSGDLRKKKFLYEYRVKFSYAPTLLATYCTIAPFEVCPTTTNKFISVILESDYIDYHGYGYLYHV